MSRYDIEGLIASLPGMACSSDPAEIRRKSRDLYAISPLLREMLAGKSADVVVSPRTLEEVVAAAAAATRLRIPITIRGAGTANYGQSVPLQGGIVLDMSDYAGIVATRPGMVRARAGTVFAAIDEAIRPTGWELRQHPSTRSSATIAGHIAGGQGGPGSVAWGVLAERGNIAGVQMVTMNETPRVLELRGPDAQLVHHTYGATGIITEVEMPTAPAWDWIEAIIAFPSYMQAVRFGVALANEAGIVKKLASVQEWPTPRLMRALGEIVPDGHSMVSCLIAPDCWAEAEDMARSGGGAVVSRCGEGAGPYGAPLTEFAFGHALWQVRKADARRTNIEGFYMGPDLPALIERVHQRVARFGPMRLELMRIGGQLVGTGSPYFVYDSPEQMADLVREIQAAGAVVSNSHSSSVRSVGKKRIGPRDLAFKRDVDPHGLLNPGRFEVDISEDATFRHTLPTDGFEARHVLPETCSMLTGDGVRLDADIWRPEAGGGPHPVLLMRHAYGRRIGSTLSYAHPAWFAAQGYVVVIQDVRGRGSSGGDFHPGLHEAADGAAAVAWAAGLPGTTGAVGMFGFSYQSLTQLMAAATAGPALRCLALAMGPWDAQGGWAYENGALRLKQSLGWGIQIAAETARRDGDAAGYTALAAAKGLPLNGEIAARPSVMTRHAAGSHYAKWLDTPGDDPYWDSISPSAHREAIASRRLPMLMLGGWFDTHLGSTLKMHRALGGGASRLMIGPWPHFPWARKLGAIDFGAAAEPGIDALHIAWFDHWLKGRPLPEAPAVTLFDLATSQWRGFDAYPGEPRDFFLAATGRATIDMEDGRLAAAAGAPGLDWLVSDPWRPAPVAGGPYATPPGPVDRSATDARGDVATFTTEPLTAELVLAGDITLELHAISDRPSFDISATLSRVLPSGQAIPLASGYATVAEAPPLRLSLTATCATFQAGDRLRLSLAGAAFPAYPVNPGTGARAADARAADAVITTIGLRYGEGFASRLTVSQPSAGSFHRWAGDRDADQG